MIVKIIVYDKFYKETYEINDLYWFEENQVHDFNDERFEFYLKNSKRVEDIYVSERITS